MSEKICGELSKALLGDTVAFLKKNVVVMNLNSEKLPPSPFRQFDFTRDQTTVSGGHIYTPIVRDASVINGFLDAYYLPWAADSGYHVILEPDAGPPLMFTALLSGCAVGYVRAKDGALRVSHHNIKGPDGETTDNAAQQLSLAFATEAVHKSDYLKRSHTDDGKFFVTTESLAFICGVRREGAWTMYAQVLKRVTRRTSTTSKFVDKTVGVKSARVF